jgi:hypothetical protein
MGVDSAPRQGFRDSPHHQHHARVPLRVYCQGIASRTSTPDAVRWDDLEQHVQYRGCLAVFPREKSYIPPSSRVDEKIAKREPANPPFIARNFYGDCDGTIDSLRQPPSLGRPQRRTGRRCFPAKFPKRLRTIRQS